MDGNELGTVHMVVGVSEFVLQVTSTFNYISTVRCM